MLAIQGTSDGELDGFELEKRCAKYDAGFNLVEHYIL